MQYCSSIMKILKDFESKLSNINEMSPFTSLLPNVFNHVLDPLLNEVTIVINIDFRNSMTISYSFFNKDVIQSSLEI